MGFFSFYCAGRSLRGGSIVRLERRETFRVLYGLDESRRLNSMTMHNCSGSRFDNTRLITLILISLCDIIDCDTDTNNDIPGENRC